MINSAFIYLFNYLKKPIFLKERKIKYISDIIYVLKLYVYYIFSVLIAIIIMLMVDKILVNYFGIFSIYSQVVKAGRSVAHSHSQYNFVIVAIIAPLLEETVFRLPLNTKRFSVALSFSILIFRISGNSFFQSPFKDIKHFLGLLYSIMTFTIINYLPFSSIRNFFTLLSEKITNKYFGIYFYTISITFGLVHITNVTDINYNLILLYPIFFMPQLILGLFLGATRMQKGFFFAFFLHFLVNSTSLIF